MRRTISLVRLIEGVALATDIHRRRPRGKLCSLQVTNKSWRMLDWQRKRRISRCFGSWL